MRGKITRIIADRRFFFIDFDYWCHFNNYDKEPELNDVVEFEPETKPDGKKFAKSVRFIDYGNNSAVPSTVNNSADQQQRRQGGNPFEEYIELLKQGYFSQKDFLKEELIIKYPVELAKLFTRDQNKNKSSTVSLYFTHCRQLEGQLKLHNDFDGIKTKLLQLIPLVNRSMNRARPTVTKEFATFIETNINLAIISEENFVKGFLPHFQSIIGYYKG